MLEIIFQLKKVDKMPVHKNLKITKIIFQKYQVNTQRLIGLYRTIDNVRITFNKNKNFHGLNT